MERKHICKFCAAFPEEPHYPDCAMPPEVFYRQIKAVMDYEVYGKHGVLIKLYDGNRLVRTITLCLSNMFEHMGELAQKEIDEYYAVFITKTCPVYHSHVR